MTTKKKHMPKHLAAGQAEQAKRRDSLCVQPVGRIPCGDVTMINPWNGSEHPNESRGMTFHYTLTMR